MVSSTICKSSVEFTAWDTSASARSSSTERVSSDVRACNSPSSRVFSIAITAWEAKFCTSAICLSVNGRTSCRKMTITPINTSSLSIGTPSVVRAPLSLTTMLSSAPASQWATSLVCNTRPFVVSGLGRKDPRLLMNSPNAGGRPSVASALNMPSWLRNRTPTFASQIRTAFSSIAWNTGCNSPGELEMMRRTSEVAICCSKACFSSRRYCAALRFSFSSGAVRRGAAERTLRRLGFGAPRCRAFSDRPVPPRSFIPPSRDLIELARMLAQKAGRRAPAVAR